ncbi:MAG: NAD-glutamate dehydrogenase [Tatlockia sp.]|nr:NAD-glutamate dehydrogenase [Tatlockia sp.]
MDLTWEESLEKAFIEKYGSKKASALIKKFENRFPPCYSGENSANLALKDTLYLEKLSKENQLEVIFYSASDLEYPLHLRLYLWEEPLPLSDLIPIFENLNLRIYRDKSYKINLTNKQSRWICDFAVKYDCSNNLKIDQIAALFKEAFTYIYFGLSENDGFNKLILAAELEWREVILLRAYSKYLHQIHFRYPQSYIEKTLVKNPTITRALVNLFKEMHNPLQSKNQSKRIESEILKRLDAVTSLDEDRIIRHLLNVIQATLRTNYFQKTASKKSKDYLALKLNSKAILDLPLPIPLYEIYVYSKQFEAIHLRNTKVARGGIRWSERPEDLRTEILGLMKAQKIKNAVIVPSGAKGGFVLKTLADSRESLQLEIVRCYKLFICGLLDLTDNIKDQGFVHPKNVVCYDGFDPYLVVAADRGTAAFSDIANDISKQNDFWLGDAFASGGSTGYDHKKMGITARGAWESIKRHLVELNIDILKDYITVAGIGDMSGDVFGNAMLYSKHLKLIAAFDHRHIFIDPSPDPEISYKERVRLFNLPTSSWEDYQAKLISTGGGVFKRSEKSITISREMKKLLKITNKALAPDDLIRAILKAPVQLLFNGGIGTYIKASTESNTEVGDRNNDWCRVNGDELQTQVVGEGGNLGFTQLGRIEYALKGGLINTDSIDNSGGVDCSDHEVNLKILLDSQVEQGKLTEKNRNQLLLAATNEVATLVLNDNYEQALLISYSAYRAKKNLSLHVEYIRYLEIRAIIDRVVDCLPDDKRLLERKTAGIGLTRPELANLSAYTKIDVKNEILNSALPEDPLMKRVIETAFPASIDKKYRAAMANHCLRREIIATQLSNIIVNEMGMTFIYRLQKEMGATVEEVVRAHTLASRIYNTDELERLILSLDFKISLSMQYEMLYNIRNLISIATRWFLNSRHLQEGLEDVISNFAPPIKTLEKLTPTLMGGAIKRYLEELTKQFSSAGLPIEKARRIATYRTMYSALNIIEISLNNKFELTKTTRAYYAVGEHFNLLWFRDQIGNDSREGHWNTLSRLTIRDELDIAQCALTVAVLKINDSETDITKLIEKWISNNSRTYARWDNLLKQLYSSNNVDYPMIFIAMRELISLTRVIE